MVNKKLRGLDEIKKEIEEPKYDYLEKFATMSDDEKSLLIRIPQEIRNKFNLKAGDKIRFYAKFEEEKKPELIMDVVRC